MSQRLNITISDELHKRLQPFKDSLNLSSVCQDALESVVRLEEAKANAMSQREAAIASLRQQAKNAKDEWFQQGKKDALQYGTDLDYQTFIDVEEFEGDGDDAVVLARNCDSCEWMIDWAENGSVPEKFQPKYFLGLIEGLKEFWSDIKDEVEIEDAA